MKALQYIFILSILATVSCTPAKTEQDTGARQETTTEASLSEIEQAIKKEEWEKARIKAENLYASQKRQMGAIESAKLAIVYISLTSEPLLDFEQTYNYALRIKDLYEQANRLDSQLTKNYLETLGVTTLVNEAYENCLYIIQAKEKAGKDSTYVFQVKKLKAQLFCENAIFTTFINNPTTQMNRTAFICVFLLTL